MKFIPYIKQIAAHRTRMKRWGDFYTWRDGRNTALQAVLYIHDIEKWLFLPFLYWYQLPGKDKSRARELYDKMNFVGSVIVRLRTLFHPIQEVQEALWMEKCFDVLDRHLDPVALEEFNLKEQRPMSDFLKSSQLKFAEYWRTHSSAVLDENQEEKPWYKTQRRRAHEKPNR